MKKGILTAILILVFAFGAMAQDSPIDKGSMVLGGTVSYMNQGGDYYKAMSATGDDATTTISIMPSLGYFIAPNILVGANINFISSSQGDDKGTVFGFGPMVGYYFNMDESRAEVKGAIYPYIKGMFMMATTKSEDGVNPDSKVALTQFGGKAGINYMLSNAVALDFGFAFTSDSYKIKEPTEGDAVTGTSMWFGAGISCFIY